MAKRNGFQTQRKDSRLNAPAAASGLPLDEDKQEGEITPEIIEAAREAEDTGRLNNSGGEVQSENKSTPADALENNNSYDENDGELLAKIRSLAKKLYPNSETPADELIRQLEEENGGREGMSGDTIRSREEDRRDAEEYRRLRKRQREYEDGRQKILDRWMRDTERLKQEVPEFDLDTAMKNDEFRELVINGTSIDGAYYAVKYHEMSGTAPRRAIMQNASSKGMRSGSGVNALTGLDDKSFKKEIKKLING